MIVIGGGAAGMMAAGTAAECGASVLLLEPNRKLGRKLRITGKGRCNVTNACPVREFMENVPRNPKFLYSALSAFSPEDTSSFFEGLGVPLKVERGRRVFPVSDNANDIAGALEAWLRRNGVLIRSGRAAEVLTANGAVRGVRTDGGDIEGGAVILCTGGASYPLTGSDGGGYVLAWALGHTVIPPRASLVPLVSPDGFCAALAGFSPRNVTLSVYEDDKLIFRELGEMLFAHFGVTGPLVLAASAHMRKFGRAAYRLGIDFKPALDEEKLDERILRDFAKYKNRDFSNALSELAPRSLIPVLVERSGIPGDTKVHSVTRAQRQTLIRLLKDFSVSVSGTRPIEEAIVTSGGVDVRQVDPRSMMSKLVDGLYFAGELLDVDAYTGGFNLQIAWATGRRAGWSAASRCTQ